MAYAAGPVVSEYRLSFAKLSGDIASVERMLKAIKPPVLAPVGGDTRGGVQAIVQVERANAALAAQVARTQAVQTQTTTAAQVGYQKLAVAQNAAAVSAQKVAQAEQQTAQAIQRTARETANATAAHARAEAAQIRLAQAQARQAAQQERLAAGGRTWTASLGESIGRIDGMIGAVAGLGGAFAAVSAAQAGLDFARTGGQIAAARQSFDALAASAGTSGQALLKSLNDAAAGTVANTDIIKSSNTALLLLGSDVASQLPQLLAVAKASATTLGTDVGQVFDSLVTGISRGSTELIDNAGITIKAGEAQAAYAASIGKSVEALSASEKQQALLNGVLTAGAGIIAQTSGGNEAASASYQRFDAAVANLTASLQTMVASGAAPAVDWLGRLAQAASDGITSLQAIGASNQNLNTQLLSGATSYEDYARRVQQAQALADQALSEAYAGDPIGRFVAQISGAIPQVEALSRSQVELAIQLQAGGASIESSMAAAAAATPAVDLLGRAIDYAAVRTPDAVASIQALEPAIVATATASDQARAQVEQMLNTYITGGLTAQELATGLQNIQVSAEAATASQQIQAAATADAQAAMLGYGDAIVAATSASLDGAAASNADALAKLEQQVAAEQTAQAHDALDQAIRAAAAAGGSAEAAAQRIAAQFGGVEAPRVRELIDLHRQLAAARAGAAASTAAATADFRAGERNVANDPTRAAFLERMAANRLKYEQEQARLAARSAGTGGGRRATGGGGSGGGAAGAAGTAAANAERKRLDLATDTQRKIQEAEQDHAEKLADIARQSGERQLAIQRQYAEKQLAAERTLRVSSLNSKADFYDALTQASPEIGDQAAQGLAAAYEQAFAQAQVFAQNGQAALASSYLQLRQRQIQEELQFQQALAAAREEGDDAEVNRLAQIEAMRKAARDEELKQLLEGGDKNQQARDEGLAGEQASTAEALAAEDERYAEQTGKITQASADKAAKLAGDEQRVRGELAQTNVTLAEQLRLSQQLATTRTTGAGLPAAQAAATAPPVGATAPTAAQAQAAAAQLIEYPALLVSVEALRADVARLDGRFTEAIAGIGSTTEAARDTASAVRSAGRGLK